MNLQDFIRQFIFRPAHTLQTGVEREFYITNAKGVIVPWVPKALAFLTDPIRYGYELSACQLEERVGPADPDEVEELLWHNEGELREMDRELGCKRLYLPVAPTDMPLDVYPDPDGRYEKIAATKTEEELRAACRVAGVHIHVGMPDHETALYVYNKVREAIWEQMAGVKSERMELYKQMAGEYLPGHYVDWAHFFQASLRRGTAVDPRKCWNIIRISVHGTIEFRFFDTTEDNSLVAEHARYCHGACKYVMQRM